MSYLLSTRGSGSHDLKGGVESFVNRAKGGNSQSSTGYVFVDRLPRAGRPPVAERAGTAGSRLHSRRVAGVELHGQPRRDARHPDDVAVSAGSWVVTRKVTLDLGVRGEIVRGHATGDITTVDTTSLLPRLAMAFDARGNGRTVVQATYGIYGGRYGQTQFATNTNVGRPSETDYVYTGPAGQGSDFAPGFDVANYSRVVFANFPTANVRIADDLSAPRVSEATAAIGQTLGDRSHVKATYVWRQTTNFVEDFADLSTGVTTVPNVGEVTNRLLRNTSDPSRGLLGAVILEGSFASADRFTLGGDYTMQLRNRGSFAGEAASQPGIPSVYGNFPEIFGPALDRLMPEGRLDNYQQHKLRVYGVLMQSLGRFGALDVAPLWRVNSGTVYSLTASIPVPQAQLARNPGYPANDINPFVRETVYFGERGAGQFKGYGVVDLADHLPDSRVADAGALGQGSRFTTP